MKKIFFNKKNTHLILLFLFFISNFIIFQNYFILANNEDSLEENDEFINYDEVAIVEKAKYLVDAGNISEGLKLLLEGLKKYKKSKVIPKKLGEIFYNQQLYPLALKYFLLANKKGDNSFYLLSMIADTYAYLNEDNKALKWFEKSFSQYLYQPYNFYSYIWILLKLELYEIAKQKIDQFYDFFSGFSYLDSALAVLYANLGEYEKSKYYYKKVLNFPGSYQGTIYYNWGILEYTFFNYNEAYSLFMKSYTNSDMPEAFLALGEIYLSALNFDLANSLFIAGLEKLQAPLILYNLFELNKLRGYHEKAIEYGDKIINYNNDNWIYRYNLNKSEHLANHYEFLYEYSKLKIKSLKTKFSNNIIKNIKNYFQILKYKVNNFYFDIMKKFYNFKVLKKYNFEYAFIEYYKRLIKIYDWNKYFYLKYLNKLEYYFNKFYGNKTGTIYFYYLECADKFNNYKLFNKYENKFLETYDKNYEKSLYLNYLNLKVNLSYKNKDYNNYLNAIIKLISINYISIKNIDVPIIAKFQYFNLSKKEISIFNKYFYKKNFISANKIKKNKVDLNLIFVINIEKINNENYIVYLINPFESKKIEINLKDILKDNINIYEIFNPSI